MFLLVSDKTEEFLNNQEQISGEDIGIKKSNVNVSPSISYSIYFFKLFKPEAFIA